MNRTSYTAHGYTRLELLSNAADPEGDPISGSPTSQPRHGFLYGDEHPGVNYYKPENGFVGEDSFTYRVCDNLGLCANATITINVVNEPPSLSKTSFTVHGYTRLDLLSGAFDPEGDVFSGSVVSQAKHGRVYGDEQPGVNYYKPEYGYTGSDSFNYKVCDNLGVCSDNVITLNVVNEAPNAVPDAYAIHGYTVLRLLGNDSDPEGDRIALSITPTQPQHGWLYGNTDGNLRDYNPYPDGYIGIDAFTYRVCDNLGACSTGTVDLFLTGNDDGNNAGPTSCNARVGEPVNVTNGNVYLQQTDYRVPGVGEGLSITRTYNSTSSRVRLFGLGWTTAYDELIQIHSPDFLRLFLPDGRAIYFGRERSTGMFVPLEAPDLHMQLTQGSGGYTLTFKDGNVHQFDETGKLVLITDSHSNQTRLTYGASNSLVSVTNSFGRVLTLVSDANGRVTSISDSLGAVTTYGYDVGGKLLSVTYPDGSRYEFTYAAVGSKFVLTEIRDALGNTLEAHTYDSLGRALTSEKHGGVERYTLSYVSDTQTDVTDALGHMTKYFFDKSKGRNVVTRVEGACECGGSQVKTWTYDDRLNVTSQTDALNRTTTYTYDANGNSLTETDALGTTTYTYNGFGQMLTKTDSIGGVTRNVYDTNRRLLSTKDALNNTTTFTYDARGLPLTVTNARGKATTFTYDEFGNLARKVDAANGTTDFITDARGRLINMTDALGHITRYEYDAAGRINKVVRPDNSSITFTYDLTGRRTRVTDGRGNSIHYAYDAAYRLTSETNAQGKTTTYAYNAMSNLMGKTDALGNTTNYEYDGFNRLVKTIHPAATSGATRLAETIEYDAGGNVTKRIDQAGRVTTHEYDAANRLKKTVDAAMQTTQYEYDARSRMTALTDAKGQRYTFAHDPLGRIVEQSRGGQTAMFSYDAVGNRTSRTDYNGATTAYTYDALNRLTSVAYPDSTSASYAYDKLSHLTSATNSNGTVSFRYDNVGRTITTTDVHNQSINYLYDTSDNRTQMSLNNQIRASYGYDSLNRVTSITDNNGATIAHSYDAANRLVSRTMPNGIATAYQYDNLNRLTRLRDATNTSVVADSQYVYNHIGSITQKASQDGVSDYAYDAVDRLTSATHPNLPTETYAYDAVGNRTSSHQSASHTYQPFNKLASTATASYSYDANGNLTQKTDATGTTAYLWDYENRLTHVVRPDGTNINYKYDALGRRVERSTSTGQLTKFVYDNQDVVRDIHQDGTTTDYLNGLGVDEKLRQQSAAETFYFTADHLGSTTALTDVGGNVVERLTYDSFGNGTQSARTRYTYTRREWDADANLYYYRARWYDPQAGRFISEDPIGFAGGVNWYAYVLNNPINKIDPLGLDDADYSPISSNNPYHNPTIYDWFGNSLYQPPGFPPNPTLVGCSNSGGAAGAIVDFIDNYLSMRDANTIGADKFFHCMANCESGRRGTGGSILSEVISEVRELFDEYIKGDPRNACDDDRRANNAGRNGGERCQPCRTVCAPFRPRGL